MSTISDSERVVLAQEIAADKYRTSQFGEDSVELTCEECGTRDTYYDMVPVGKVREGFIAGWDSALEYAGRKASEGIAHLDKEK